MLLGAFAKLLKATNNFIMSVLSSVHLSVRIILGSHWMDFYEILYLNFFKTL